MNTLIIKQVRRKLNKPHCSIGDLKRKITNATAWFIACLVFIGVCGVYNIYSNATDVYADYTISMTSSGAQNIDVVPMVDGSTGTNIGVDSINVTTDCKAGYNFSLSTSTTNNNLYLNGSSSNNTAGKYFTPANGTSTLANSSNTWGYYYNSAAPTTAPTSSNVFLPVPKSNAAAASIITPTASATNINDSFNIYYGVAVGNGMAPGTYKMANSGAIVYYTTMAEACLPYTVVFNPTSTAGGTSVTGTGTMASQTIQPGVATNLTTNSFTAPAGYEFAGWNTKQNGTGTSYTDGQSVTDLTTGGTSITLYAQWKQKLYLQEMSLSDCQKNVGINGNAANIGDEITVLDSRDGNDYTVRYINGQCWMTQNLRFQGTSLNSITSNVTSTYTEASPYSITWYSLKDTSGCKGTSATTNNTSYMCKEDSGDTSTGVWYNYSAATAHTITGTSNSTDATYDICPKNWHLPTNSEFSGILSYSSAFSPVTGGFYRNGALSSPGYGFWWSATAYSSAVRYYLSWDDSSLNTVSANYRYYGRYVRCVKKPSIADIAYMQDVTTDMVASMTDGDSTTLKDKRDENEYTVRKINGQLWMTQNLRFQGDSLNSVTSNVANTYTESLPYNIDWHSLKDYSGCKGSYINTNNSTLMCKEDSGDIRIGVWYNYSAATAHTITGTSNSTNATYDICPAGWHLPTNSGSSSDFVKLVGNTTSGPQSPTSGLSAFNAIAGGVYSNGSLKYPATGSWWSATSYANPSRYVLNYDSDSGKFTRTNQNNRYEGNFVRCVRSS